MDDSDQLTENQLQRVSAIVMDDEDSGDEDNNRPKHGHKPGSITRLGVRIDKGHGLLSTEAATKTLEEMDSAIASLRQWQRHHEREMADLMQKHAAVIEETCSRKPEAELEQEFILKTPADLSQVEQQEAVSISPLQTDAESPPDASSKLHTLRQSLITDNMLALVKESVGMNFGRIALRSAEGWNDAASSTRPQTAQPFRSPSRSRPSSSPTLCTSLSFQSSRDWIRASGSPLETSSSSESQNLMRWPPASQAKLPPLSTSEGGLLTLPSSLANGRSLSRLSSNSAREGSQDVPAAPPWEQKNVLSSSASRPNSVNSKDLQSRCSAVPMGVPLREIRSQDTRGKLSVRESTSMTAVGPHPSGAAVETHGVAERQMRGQQLLDELEAELRLLDEAEGCSDLKSWCADYEIVLAKMDRLQTGYQVQLRSSTELGRE
ncbi:hypothetical protein CEUSTIGMA_g6899.t1 [Chlamydomonas eustigma]|uniref:Uncharacterized protein n=1 Tax=Chlamydomonas eustigma TaxID=1157962 RepID=A0A250X8P9_9CHLO|nr:hypothetical protein CEUSTIGMA_g6899.t1 [Chlamydomonas eustigma]|eukprot:GAX79458.1 hypothetical protein CEUSTIGMA_g6899.t1 [Chlamydomonas eustigma]